jgi:autotransporter-associated beta strand protein
VIIGGTVMAGTNGFTLDGGSLNLFKSGADNIPYDPANTWTGDVILNSGMLLVQTTDVSNQTYAAAIDLALDGLTSFTFYNGSTLRLRPDDSTTPQYGTMDANLIVPEGQAGNLVLPVRFSGSSGDGGAIGTGLGGTLTGSGTLNVLPKYLRGNIVGDWSAFSGQINVAPDSATGGGDEFRFGSVAGYPNASVDLGGTITYTFRYYPALTANTILPIGMLSGATATAFIAGSSTAAYTLFFDVGAKQTNTTDYATLAASIVNGSGPAGIIWRGAGTWALTGDNTYTGGTVISNGVLQIGEYGGGTVGNGPVTNYASLVFARYGDLFVPGAISGPGKITNVVYEGTVTLNGSNTYSGPTYVSIGKLALGTLSKLAGGVVVSDGASLGARYASAGTTLSIGSLSMGAGCALDFDFTSLTNSPVTVVSNTGALTMNGDVTVNISGPGLAVGTITLLRYGSRTGTGNFVLGTLPPHVTSASINHDTGNRLVTLTINATFDDTLRWLGGSAGAWDIGNPANQIWREIGSGVLTNYYAGAKVRFDDLATGTTAVDLTTTLSPSVVTVSNSALNYTFGGLGSLSGSVTVFKGGTGTLTLTNVNYNTGGAMITGGTLQVGDGTAAASMGTGAITNDGTLCFNSTAANTVADVISGTGIVVQEGSGELTLSGNNTHAGVTVRSNSTFLNNNANAVGAAGSTLTLDSGTLHLTTVDVSSGKSVVVAADSAIVSTVTGSSGNRRIDSPVYGTNATLWITNSALLTFNQDMHGFSGTIKMASQTSQTVRFNAGGDLLCSGSRNAIWEFLPAAGSTNWMQCRINGTIELGAISGGPGMFEQQGSGAGDNILIYEVGALNLDTAFTGWVRDTSRTTAFRKVGTGTLTMNDVGFINKGALTVSNGVLAFTGYTANSSSNSAIVVAAPGILNVSAATDPNVRLGQGTTVQTLRGNGSIVGNVVMGANARLEPGFSVGTLTVSGSATLGGTNVMELTTAPAAASDRLTASSIAYGGTLILTNIGDIKGSNVFQLFSGSLSGTFANVVTQTLAGVTWDLSQLNSNGRVTLVGPPAVDTTPTNMSYSFNSGTGQLTLQWPASHLGWSIQSNSVSLNAPGSWVTIPGSEGVTQLILNVDTTKTNVFYRMYYLAP